MRRLYLQIYMTIILVTVLFAVLSSAVWFHLDPRHHNLLRGVARMAAEMLPGPEAPPAAARAELERWAELLRIEIALFSAGAERIAEAGGHPPAPSGRTTTGWMRSSPFVLRGNPGRGPAAAIHLDDGRWLVIRHRRSLIGVVIASGLLAIATAIGAFPLVRRLTRRLERLEAGVKGLGRGELGRRVEVEGNDEIARLAASFNRAASRIESLVEAQRHVLAGASHELRTPLSRMRVATELLGGSAPERIKRRLTDDIAELDELIDELLMASRIEALGRSEPFEEVDLLALVAEEGSRVGAELEGEQAMVRGDPRMLRRLVRNLLHNAARHGQGPVETEVAVPAEGGAVVRVADRGPGVPAAERERIFTPFYRLSGSLETSPKGVGLGLALVRQIAHHHGGTVECHDREAGGAIFEVRLPSSQ